MKHLEVIDDIYLKYGEYIEMQEDPDLYIIDIMACEISALKEKIQYLEKRIKDV